jgi:hypothetical protein
MLDLLEELTVILTIIWWPQKLRRNCQQLNEQQKSLTLKTISGASRRGVQEAYKVKSKRGK